MNLGPFVFQQPIWLLLLLPLVATFFIWRIPSRLLTVLRVVLVVLLVLAMTQPQLMLPTRSGTIVVLADRSRSMPDSSEEQQLQTISLLLNQMGNRDQLAVVSFGANPVIDRNPGGPAVFGKFESEPSRDASDLHAAIDKALSLIPVGDSGRLLILSDGRWTGRKPNDLAARALQRNVPIDYRLFERSAAGDTAILSLETPASVLPGEAYTLTAWVRVPVAQDVEFELLNGKEVIASGTKHIASGDGRLTFRDRAGSPGTIQYTLRIKGSEHDPILENNRLQKLVGVEGAKPILLVNQTGQSQLSEILEQSGMRNVVVKGGDIEWTLQNLSNYSGLVIENTDAKELGAMGLSLVPEWVRNTGAGMMMTGGRSSFALGGYYLTDIGELLPVSMEQRKEHRKLSSAIVVALDRSGSMGMPIGGSRVKMDLANLGTAEVIKMLSPVDEIGVIAVDSAPQEIIKMGPNSDPQAFAGRVMTIDSMGGGIYVYQALLRAFEMLQHSKSNTRHIILFADAADAEEPGQYRELLAKAREGGITCSVIGLGTERDTDAEFLKDVALRGDGNCYFSSDPVELPRLFTQDTFVMSRQTFIEDATPFRFTGGMATLTGQSFDEPPSLGGYNLCYGRPQALVSALTTDEYGSPVIASWQRGLGRVLAYTGQVDGKYTGDMAAWDKYATMLASLTRWTMGGGEKLPNNMLLTQEVRDGSCIVRLHLDPEREAASIDAAPKVVAIKQLGALMLDPETVEMNWADPDTLEAVLPLHGEETLVATLSLQDREETPPVSLAPVCLPYSPEFRPVEPGQGRDALAELAEITQGQERIDVSEIWGSLKRVPRSFDLSKWLLFAGILCFLIEILQRRTGLVVAYWQRFVAWLVLVLRLKQWSRKLAAIGAGNHSGTDIDRSSDATVDDETDGRKLSWWAKRRISREQGAALQWAKKRAADRTGDADAQAVDPTSMTGTGTSTGIKTATSGAAKESPPPKGDLPAGHESMFDAMAKARQAAKDRTKEN